MLDVAVSKLPLKTEASKHKFRLLSGAHWDSKRDSFKLTTERFTTREENAQWASQTLNRLLEAANVGLPQSMGKRRLLTHTSFSLPAQDTSDPMSDIPLDPRPSNAKYQRRAKRLGKVSIKDYPSEWLDQAKKSQSVA